MEKRKPRFAIVLVSAALTFVTLWATVGFRHFHHGRHCTEMNTAAADKSQANP